MKPHAKGLSTSAYAQLRSELPHLAERLSDAQMLDVADRLHALVRERNAARASGRVTLVYAGLNDNKPLPLPPIEQPYF